MTELTTPVKNIENGKTLIGKSDDKEKSEEKKINTGSSPKKPNMEANLDLFL